MLKTDETNSICSDDETTESVIIKDKEVDEDEDKDEEEDEEEYEEEDEEEDDEDDDEEDDNNEFDSTIIQYEMLKNFFIDKEGNNISTHLNSISHELRKLNKIAVKLLEKN